MARRPSRNGSDGSELCRADEMHNGAISMFAGGGGGGGGYRSPGTARAPGDDYCVRVVRRVPLGNNTASALRDVSFREVIM